MNLKEEIIALNPKMGILLTLTFVVLAAEMFGVAACLAEATKLAEQFLSNSAIKDGLKGLCRLGIWILACVPGGIVMYLTGIIMSKCAMKGREA